MAKKKSSALFEAMSRSKGLKPAAGSRAAGTPSPTAAKGAVADTNANGAATSAGGAPTSAGGLARHFDAPKWFRRPTGSSAPAAVGEARPAVENDPERQELKVRLSYTTMGIIAFGVLTTVVLAVWIGREWSSAHEPGDKSSKQLLLDPPQANVLNVPSGQGGGRRDPARDPGSKEGGSTPPENHPAGGASSAGGESTPPPQGGSSVPANPGEGIPSGTNPPGGASVGPSGRVSRVMGLNYIVVQSYPDEADAKAAVALLSKNGVPATVEKGLEGFPKWHIVVTAQGYPARAKETEDLRKRIDQVSADQSRREKKWKAWTPMAYRWR